jgi:hypothetical protein
MQKWEYTIVELDGSEERVKELNNYGGAFWEAVGITRMGAVTTVLLKRPLAAEAGVIEQPPDAPEQSNTKPTIKIPPGIVLGGMPVRRDE